MARLTYKRRMHLRKSTFALKTGGKGGKGKYPMPDASHARNALSRVSQMEKAGKISASGAARVRAKAHKMLGTSSG